MTNATYCYARLLLEPREWAFLITMSHFAATVEPEAPHAPTTAGSVRLADVERTFPSPEGARTVLRDLTLDIDSGEIVTIVGPSGCGKSTLLRLIGGLDSPTDGSISIDGERIRAHDDTTAIAFQEPRLLPWRTIAQNVALGLPRGTRGAEARERVAELLELVGLSHAAHQRPREVSGGMAQRASLARALARSPRVLLLDEPFGALDALTRLKMHDLLLDIHEAQPTTVVLVTHDVEEALYLADRVLMLRNLHATQAEPERPRAKVLALGSTSGIGAVGSAPTTGTTPEAEAETPSEPSSLARLVTVPGSRPRDRGARTFTDLRTALLDGLGVHKLTIKENA